MNKKSFISAIDYKNMTIAELAKKIDASEIFLPAIQRNFVWSESQIENLWDSIYKSYPIGTFLFWQMDKAQAKDYSFYKFLSSYHERDSKNEKLDPNELRDSIYAVLDGQQRLTAIYLSLVGSYSPKLSRKPRDLDGSYPQKFLYFNCLYGFLPKVEMLDDDEDLEESKAFKFQREIENNFDGDSFWICVNELLAWKNASDMNSYIDKKAAGLGDEMISHVRDTLTDLRNIIHATKVINYCEIIAADIDSVLDVFVRINSGGTKLSKSDLIFSTVSTHWGDAREEFQSLLDEINQCGEGFHFETDFLITCCLMMINCPLELRMSNFKRENVTRIKNDWENIANSIWTTVDMLVEFGFSEERMSSKNAIIPVIYYIYKKKKINKKDREEIRKFIILSNLANIYSAQTLTRLQEFRRVMTRMITYSNRFDVKIIKKLSAEYDKLNLDIDCENVVDTKYGAHTFMILSLLYPNADLKNVVQDHIHPQKAFDRKRLYAMSLSRVEMQDWLDKKDRLANLQLVSRQDDGNVTKRTRPFIDWLIDCGEDIESYKRTHLIPDDLDLSFDNFNEFYEIRKEYLADKLLEALQ